MIFNQSNRQDIERYYRNCYVKFPETGERLHYIRELTRTSVLGVDDEDNEFELFLSDEFPYQVDYVLPRKSYFQMGKNAHLLYRIPAKQYQRGLSESNTVIEQLRKDGSAEQVGISFPLLKAYVEKQQFPTFEAAITNKEGNYSVALSARFALAPAARQLCLDGVVVAMVKPLQKRVICQYPLLRPEVEEVVALSTYKVE